MKPLRDGSACRRSPSGVAVILTVLVSLLCFSLILFSSLSEAADDQTPRAVRRSSSESGAAIKDQRRVALVIGNSDYKIHPLQNPAHDAEDISGVLRNLGFSVQTKVNADHRGMEEAVNKFVQEIQNGDVALFYFSGHGVQVKGENFLIPLDDSIQMEADVRFKTLNASLVLAKMEESRNRTNIVILNACRNNPFKGLFRSASTGLSKMDAPKGTFIAYATSPDSVAADGTGRNSPYTKHLMDALKVKDVSIAQAFTLVANAVDKETAGQQTPWILSSLLNDFYFNPSHEASLPATEPPRMTASPGSEPSPDYKEQLEREKRESEHEIAKLREARRVAALERERLEREKQEIQQERERRRERTPATSQDAAGTEHAKGVIELAERSTPRDQYLIGLCFLNGGFFKEYRCPQDRAEGLKWLRRSAQQGYETAKNELRAWGGSSDEIMDIASRGTARDQYLIGLCFLNGGFFKEYRCPRDRAEGLKWLNRAAQQGYETANSELRNLGATSSR